MDRPLFVFAPGAGAPSSSQWMQAWARRLESIGKVVTLDYPYMLNRRRSPDPLPKLIDAHRRALTAARADHRGLVVLIGKSMGGRVGCHVATEDRVDGLVCLGYPLQGVGGKVRDEVLKQLGTPVLFVQGTKDKLCPLEQLEQVRVQMTAKNDVIIVQGGDHSLVVGKTLLKQLGRNQDEIDAAVLEGIATFVKKLAQRD